MMLSEYQDNMLHIKINKTDFNIEIEMRSDCQMHPPSHY